MVFSKKIMGILKGQNTLFSIRGIGRPELYLGGDIEVYKDNTGNFHYVTSARTCCNPLYVDSKLN